MSALSELGETSLYAAAIAATFSLTANYLGDNATWILYLLFFATYIRPGHPTFGMWIVVSVVMSLLDMPAFGIMIMCTWIDACLRRDFVTAISFAGTLIGLEQLIRSTSSHEEPPEVIGPPRDAIAATAGTSDWNLFKTVGFLSVWALVLIPRSLFAPDDTNRGLPEGKLGIIHASILQVVQLYVSLNVQWCLYVLHWFSALSFSGSIAAAVEGVAINLATWYFGYTPVVACIAYVVVNAFVHPVRQHAKGESSITPIVRSQMAGFAWFMLTTVAFDIVKACVGPRLATFLAPILGFMFLAITTFLVGPQVYVAYRRSRRAHSPVYEVERDARGRDLYKYESLPSTSTIRLLRIIPSLSNSDPIRCEMVYGAFEGEVFAGPTYTGISYRWDSADTAKVLIYINDQPFEVFPTVHAILRALRTPFRFQCVWIDSVCINQSDEVEKAAQVQLMRLIYENCSFVVGWLGGDNPDPGNIFETSWASMTDFWNGRKPSSYLASVMLGRINSSRYLQHVSPNEPPAKFFNKHPIEYWQALEKLVTKPYFTRIWIVQEIVASRNVILYYSGNIIPWEKYARAMTIISSHGLRNFVHYIRGVDVDFQHIDLPGIDNALVMENLRLWYGRYGVVLPSQEQKLLPLEDTLKLCLRFESTWEVDRIYALLGLISDAKNLNIVPDYGDGRANAVFTSISQSLLQTSQPFRLLRFAGIGQTRRLNGLPSWVPDWTTKLETCVLSHTHARYNYRATKGSKPSIDIVRGTARLQCRGMIIDRITHLSDIFTGHPSKDARNFQDALDPVHARVGKEYRTGQSTTQAFWRTLVGDMDPRERPASQSFVDAWRTVINDFEAGPPSPNDRNLEKLEAYDDARILFELNDTEDNRYSYMLSTDLSHAHPNHSKGFTSILGPALTRHPFAQHPLFAFGRRLCVTEQGYIGLVPANTKLGDSICLLHGSMTPHVLRRHDASEAVHDQHYQLVGECYVHGIMDGEAFEENAAATVITLV